MCQSFTLPGQSRGSWARNPRWRRCLKASSPCGLSPRSGRTWEHDIWLEPQSRKILHAADYLVDQELDVVVGELLSLDDVVQVSPHQVGHLGWHCWCDPSTRQGNLPCKHQQTGQGCFEVWSSPGGQWSESCVSYQSHKEGRCWSLKIWEYLVDKFEWSDEKMLISQLTFSWTMCLSILSSL